jgi:hypothetical protein
LLGLSVGVAMVLLLAAASSSSSTTAGPAGPAGALQLGRRLLRGDGGKQAARVCAWGRSLTDRSSHPHIQTLTQTAPSSASSSFLSSVAGLGDGSHKPLWPLDGRDFGTLVLATLGLVIAAGGGIGGGGK